MIIIITESQYKLLNENLPISLRRRLSFDWLRETLDYGVLEHMTQGINITHMDRLDVQVSCMNNKMPPTPPFANIAIQYNRGAGLTNFPGSPFNGPAINVSSGVVDNAANAGSPTFTVQCS